jgi:hypothetical protein
MKCRMIFIVVFLFVLVSDASAMRCNRRLIQVGDFVSKMFTNCGEPVFSIDLSTAFVNKQRHTYQQAGRIKTITVLNGKITRIDTTN